MAVSLGLIGMVWSVSRKGFETLNLLIYPQNADHIEQLMNEPDKLPPILMTVPSFFPAIAIGCFLTNALMWLVPEVRRDSEAVARGVKWASFRQTQRIMFVVAVVLAIPAIIAGVIGAYLLGRS